MRSGWARIAVSFLAIATVVGAEEFQATLAVKQGNEIARHALYFSGESYCMVFDVGSRETRVVVDADSNTTSVIVMSDKFFIRKPCEELRDLIADPIQTARHVPKEFKLRLDGKETIDGHECEKRMYTRLDAPFMTIWYSTELNLPLRIKEHSGWHRTITIGNIKKGPVEASLFDVPSGFRRLDRFPDVPQERPSDSEAKAAIRATAHGRAPWGRRLAQGAEVRIHFTPPGEASVSVFNESTRAGAVATVRFFREGKPQGPATRVELGAVGRRTVGKPGGIDADEAHVVVVQGACVVTGEHALELRSGGTVELHYLRPFDGALVFLFPGEHVRVIAEGDFQDGPSSDVTFELKRRRDPKEHVVTLKNGEFWRLRLQPSDRFVCLDAGVKSGGVKLRVLQGADAKPLAPLKLASSGQVSTKQRALVERAIRSDDIEWMRAAFMDGLPPDVKIDRCPLVRLVASEASAEMLALALRLGVEAETIEKDGDSLLLAAAQNPYHWRANQLLLLKKGVDPNHRDQSGATPLHHMSAIAGGSKPEIIGSVRLLLEHGAEANAKNGVGDTPLHIAVRAANLALVRLLMEHGANANFVGDKGLTPMGLARKAGNVEMVAALSKE